MFEDGGSQVESGTWRVVTNQEDQYSIWPQHSPVPTGWIETGFTGPKADCLANIAEVWVDMRPRSLREADAAFEANR